MTNNPLSKMKIYDLEQQLPNSSSNSHTRDRQEERRSKRSKLERHIDILEVVSNFGPIRRTHILYKANLAWTELTDLLGELQEAGALRKIVKKEGTFFGITEVGSTILANYANVKISLPP